MQKHSFKKYHEVWWKHSPVCIKLDIYYMNCNGCIFAATTRTIREY